MPSRGTDVKRPALAQRLTWRIFNMTDPDSLSAQLFPQLSKVCSENAGKCSK